MEDYYESFITKIYSYCDEHVGERVLLPAFMNLWNREGISKKKKYVLTCGIINQLSLDGILKEVPNLKKFESAYPRYRILKHGKLIQ